MTKEDAQRLFELQTVDSAIDDRERILAELDDGTTALAALEQARAELAALQEDLHAKQARQRKLELDLETILADRKERSARAYGGTVSDLKELTALEKKIEELGRNADRHEDMILALLEEIEGVEGAIAEQQARVDGLAAEHTRIAAHYERTTAQARAEIAELQARRAELVAQIEPALLNQYEDLRARFDRIAVAAMRAGTCSVCNVAVARALHPVVARGTMVVRCDSCRRILVVPEEG